MTLNIIIKIIAMAAILAGIYLISEYIRSTPRELSSLLIGIGGIVGGIYISLKPMENKGNE